MKKFNMEKNIFIVIPSYKEGENIRLLLKKIFTHLSHARVIIIDDSPESEHDEMKRVMEKIKNAEVVWRNKKSGRGSAVMDGFRIGLEKYKYNLFFELDADLSHDPKEFDTFLKKQQSTHADLVIGSRYLPQSKIINWPAKRLILSKVINKTLNMLLGLGITDYTNGFRLYNKRAVKFLLDNPPKEKGFITLSETAYLLKKSGHLITEVPITFTDRKHGKSSAGVREFLGSLRAVVRIRLTSYSE